MCCNLSKDKTVKLGCYLKSLPLSIKDQSINLSDRFDLGQASLKSAHKQMQVNASHLMPAIARSRRTRAEILTNVVLIMAGNLYSISNKMNIILANPWLQQQVCQQVSETDMNRQVQRSTQAVKRVMFKTRIFQHRQLNV